MMPDAIDDSEDILQMSDGDSYTEEEAPEMNEEDD